MYLYLNCFCVLVTPRSKVQILDRILVSIVETSFNEIESAVLIQFSKALKPLTILKQLPHCVTLIRLSTLVGSLRPKLKFVDILITQRPCSNIFQKMFSKRSMEERDRLLQAISFHLKSEYLLPKVIYLFEATQDKNET